MANELFSPPNHGFFQPLLALISTHLHSPELPLSSSLHSPQPKSLKLSLFRSRTNSSSPDRSSEKQGLRRKERRSNKKEMETLMCISPKFLHGEFSQDLATSLRRYVIGPSKDMCYATERSCMSNVVKLGYIEPLTPDY